MSLKNYRNVNEIEMDIYIAIRKSDGKKIILKEFDFSEDHIFDKYCREIASLSSVKSKFIVSVYDIFIYKCSIGTYLDKHEETPQNMDSVNCYGYIEMEYFEINLHKFIKQRNFSYTEFIILTRKLLTSLQEIHTNKILHIDIKPWNIVVRYNGEDPGDANFDIRNIDIVFIDFGTAYLTNDNLEALSDFDYCTWEYRSPERFLGRHMYDCAHDIWAIGIIMLDIIYNDSRKLFLQNDTDCDHFRKSGVLFREIGIPAKLENEPWKFYHAQYDTIIEDFEQYGRIKRNRGKVTIKSILTSKLNKGVLKGIKYTTQDEFLRLWDFMSHILDYDPKTRYTIYGLLNHDFLKQDFLKNDTTNADNCTAYILNDDQKSGSEKALSFILKISDLIDGIYDANKCNLSNDIINRENHQYYHDAIKFRSKTIISKFYNVLNTDIACKRMNKIYKYTEYMRRGIINDKESLFADCLAYAAICLMKNITPDDSIRDCRWNARRCGKNLEKLTPMRNFEFKIVRNIQIDMINCLGTALYDQDSTLLRKN